MTLQVAVAGAAGRMGRAVISQLAQDPQAKLVGALEPEKSPQLGQDAGLLAVGTMLGVTVTSSLDEVLANAQVAIDFTTPAATAALLRACQNHKVAAVVGTTGLDQAAQDAIGALSKVAPVVVAANFSTGVNVLLDLAARAVKLLGSDYDIEVVEMHHRAKVDAPSGTAVRLAERLAQARGLNVSQATINGRSGQTGARPSDQIGVHALRGGDVVGDHTVVLAGPGERLELTHRAQNRTVFAAGALRAAHWAVRQPPGRYDMANVLEL